MEEAGMETSWVDFKAVKQSVPIERVLGRYRVKLRRVGQELRGRCPIHQGEGTESFHASTEKNAFHCFSCGAKGNVLDFVAAMEKCTVREAALRLADWFAVSTAAGPAPAAIVTAAGAGGETARQAAAGESEEPNQPLNFTLKGVAFSHPYLEGRGVDAETAEYFGLGYFGGRGSMHGRVVIPIDNERGQLVAYAGRSIDGSEPKYKLPLGFKKSQVLYNLSRAVEEAEQGTVVVVEGFFDCVKVTQAGFAAVALMGCSLSARQEHLLAEHFERALVMLDGDEAGQKAADTVVARLSRRLWVKAVRLPGGKQPDKLALTELRTFLAQ
jgi:DNA primase